MDASLRQFQVAGMAAAVAAWDHRLTLSTHPAQVLGSMFPTSQNIRLPNGIVLVWNQGDNIWEEVPRPGGQYGFYALFAGVGTEPQDLGVVYYTVGYDDPSGDDGIGYMFRYDGANFVRVADNPEPGNFGSWEFTYGNGSNGGWDGSPSPFSVTSVVLVGVQTDVEVDPEQIQQFGFHVKRVFSFYTNDTTILSSIKTGMSGVDSANEPCKFLYYKRDFLGVHLYFGSVNR